MAPPYKLSDTLAGHESDVRSLAVSPSSTAPVLFSSSRDGSARSWFQGGMDVDGKGGGGWTEGVKFTGQHDGFVNAVESFVGEGEGFLATAGQDKLIHVWPLPTSFAPSESVPTPSHTLIGHEGNVCALNASSKGDRLVSGSWDKTAKVWSTKDFQLSYTLEGHDQAVWAVLALNEGDDLVLTGAADNLVKLWKGAKATVTFRGHTQAVRALAKLDQGVGDGSLFASAGNDGSIRLWSLTTGDAIHVLNGHDSFVYSLSPIPDSFGGGLISGGEDRTMRVWRAADGECEQTIVIPAISVWAVKTLPNGDIAAGSSDGLVRVFTRSDKRVADAETLANFDQEVSKTALNPSQVGDVKKSDLPGIEALSTPGKKEGQVIMVKTVGGSVEAHQWSSATRTWQKIGEVVDAVGSSRKQLYMGQEYDYVFDVDFKDGAQPLKLPYNVTDNPYEAAQRFLFRNELPQEYIDQVVQFIETNTGGVALGSGASSEYVDPYTGSSRYTGGGSGSAPRQGPSANAGFSGDPFTGGGRSAPAAPATPRLLPHTTFLTFTQANLPPLRAKVGQLNDALTAEGSSHALSADDVAAVDKIVTYLLVATAATTGKSTAKLAESESAVALKLLQWPAAQRFPALDLIRLLSLSSPLPESIPAILETLQDTSATAKEQEINTMLGLRALANAFSTPAGRSLMGDEASEILETLKRRGQVGLSKNGKVALATVALNYSVLAVQKTLDEAAGSVAFELVADLLRDSDGEVVYRALVSLGNLLLSPTVAAGVPAAGLQRYKTLAKDAAKRLPEARNKAVVAELDR